MIESHVQKLAKAAAMVDPMDLPALVSLGELFSELSAMLGEPELAPLSERARHSADLLERIVMHEIQDLDATFAEINQNIEYAQEIASALAEGRSVESVPAPGAKPTGGIDKDLLDSWISGCGDLLEELEALTVGLESEPSDEALAEVRRGIHTLKGECGVLSLAEAQKICHEAESLIDACSASGSAFPASQILSVLDWMKGYTRLLAQNPAAKAPAHEDILSEILSAGNGSPKVSPAPKAESEKPGRDAPGEKVIPEPADAAPASDPDALVQFPATLTRDENLGDFLTEAREHIASGEEAILSLESDLENLELINTVFRSFHTIKGVAGFMNLTPIVHAAHNAEYLLDEARKQTIKLNSSYLDLILESCDVMTQLLGVLDGGPAPKKSEFDRHIAQLQRASKGEQVETRKRGSAQAPPPAQTSAAKAEPSAQGETRSQAEGGTSAKKKPAEASVKVNTERLDNLVTMVGELVIAQQMVIQDPSVQAIDDQRFQRNMSQAAKIIRDLQEVAMSLRMVTLKGTFQKMARLVRDVSAKANKSVQFVMEGEDTELDRTVVEEIGDPLVHMIRNSCDHGIETAEDRVRAGKPATGTLTLRAYHQGGSIIIEIQDDGKGLDRQRIVAKAIEKGIYTPDRNIDEIPESEVFNLIMLPGFSTAPKVTDISGRGVGMDVVRRNIEALRGKIEIQSVAGKGTTFKLSLPLTMAIIDGMIVRVGSQRYVVPTLAIEQSFRPQPEQIHTVANQGEMAMVRGSLLPVYRLNRIFNLTDGAQSVNEGLLLVLEANGTRCCMLIDEIIGQQQVVIKRLGQGLQPLRGTSGGAILGDGRVALIIDVTGLLAEATQSESK